MINSTLPFTSSRNRFRLATLSTLSTLSTAALLTSVACASQSANPDSAQSRQPSQIAAAISSSGGNRKNTTAAPQIYTFESDANGFNTKTFFYDNGQEVVAFDTQFTPQAAQQAIDFLRTKTSHPITFAVITHPNPDKFNGIATFQSAGAKVVASDLTVKNMPSTQAYKQYYFVQIAKIFTYDNYPKMGKVDQTFSNRTQLRLANGETIQLEELASPGVSTNQTVAYISRANALMVGDLVHHHAHAWLEGGIVNGSATPTLNDWIGDLRLIQSEFAAMQPVVYGGRGNAASLNLAIDTQVQYLTKANTLVRNYIQSLGGRRTELDGANAGAHYAAIQKIFEREFPDYELSYMILYGAYGLVNAINHGKN